MLHNTDNYNSLSGRVRKDILEAAHSSGKVGAHIASSLSLVEICIAILEDKKDGDKLILSKGHGALGYYASMHQLGLISDEQFATFEDNGGEFPGQPSRSDSNHIDYSGGSLGMGLSYAVGVAKCFREDKAGKDSRKAYVILGDGECNEGSVWEAAGLASKWQLGNLCVVVDCNGLQSDGKCDEIIGQNLQDIWASFGWNVQAIDGHDVSELKAALCKAKELPNTPSVILAKTIKGCGVSFMENDNGWHHSELTDENFSKAIEEIGGRYGI